MPLSTDLRRPWAFDSSPNKRLYYAGLGVLASGMEKVSAVIPAYNEAARIRRVLDAVASSAVVDEVIVVDDGSDDGTAVVAARHNGAWVVRLPRNQGKAAAMLAGVRQARNPVVVFLDADLTGLTADHVRELAAPVLRGEVDMTVGQFRGGRGWITLWQRLVPSISGQRAMYTHHFLGVPGVERKGFGVELAIARHAVRRGLRVRRVHLSGVSHVTKEEKRGLPRGLWERVAMYGQMLATAMANGNHRLSAPIQTERAPLARPKRAGRGGPPAAD